MADRSLLPRYYYYQPLEEFVWQQEPMIRTAIVLFAFALLFTFYFNNLVLVGVILYLIAIALPIYPIFSYLAKKEAHLPKPADEEIDAILFEDFENVVKKRALAKLEVNAEDVEDDKVLLVPGPIYWKNSTLGEHAIFRHMGRDGVYRYTAWEIMVLVLMEKYVSIYECTYNWYGNGISDERTSEFFYNDIIAVKTQTIEKERELIEGGTISQAQVFKLLTLSGDAVEVEVNKNVLSPQPRIGEFTDVAIQSIRNMLREKKYKEVEMEVVRNEEPVTAADEEEISENGSSGSRKLPPPRRDDNDDEFLGEV